MCAFGLREIDWRVLLLKALLFDAHVLRPVAYVN